MTVFWQEKHYSQTLSVLADTKGFLQTDPKWILIAVYFDFLALVGFKKWSQRTQGDSVNLSFTYII